jgi:hypothetical protein
VTDDLRSRLARRTIPDWLLAVIVFVALGGVYTATLLPGLGGTEDTAKFQYVGPSLGTAHDPGYPLYLLAAWAASKVPVGTLAYRVNVLSAFWGAAAAAFVFIAMRRMAVPRGLAVAVALGLGLGRSFWEHSTYAEAYTQACALFAGAIAAALAWEGEGRERHLFSAIAATSLAFGTHLIVVGSVPILVWLVLTRYRWRLPLRVAALGTLIVVLGIAQYGYVWIRTVQGARYLEARATSIAELVGVMRGAQFGDQTFRDPPEVIVGSRLPRIARAVGTELGAVAAVFAALGVVAEWRRRRRSAVLLAGAFLGPALLLSMLGGVATEGILLPALMPLWALVGAGAAWLWSLAASPTLPRGARGAALAIVAVLAAAVPAMQARENFARNNKRGDTFDTYYFADLFRRISGRTAFLDENYVVGQMLEYQRYATGTPGVTVRIPRNPEVVATLLRDGGTVYGFSEAIAELDGRVSARQVTLSAPSLDARLAAAPDGLLVVVAGIAQKWPALDAIGAAGDAPRSGRGIVVGVRGLGSVVATPPGFEGAIAIARGEPLGTTGRRAAMDLRVEVRGADAVIEVDGQPVVRSSGGLAVAEMGSTLRDAYVLSPLNALRPPLEMTRRPLFEVTAVPDEACTPIGDGKWSVLAHPGSAGRLVGRIDNVRPFDAEWLVYLAADDELRPRILSAYGPGEPALEAEAFVPARDGQRLRRRLDDDRLEASAELLSSPTVTRLAVRVDDHGQWTSFRIGLGGRPRAGWGRATIDQPSRARALSCGVAPDPIEPDTLTGRAAVYVGPGGDWLFGPGWQGPESTPAGFQRALRGGKGRLLLPIAQPAAITVRMSVQPIGMDAAVALSLNGGTPVAASGMATPGWNDLSWTPDARQWRAGLNELTLHVRRPDGSAPAPDAPSIRVRAIELDWSPPPS